MYQSRATICDGVVRPGVDYVYVSSRMGGQEAIAEHLNNNIKDAKALIDNHDEDCVKQVFRVFCHFYLPPCGNSTHPVPPSSICQEECQIVQNKCQKMWDTLLLAFKNIDQIIQCNDTSRLLFPVPHCCTGAGLGLSFQPSPSSVNNSPKQNSLPNRNGSSRNIAVEISVSFLILTVAVIIAVSLIFLVSFKIHRRKKIQKMQLDIMAK